MKFNIDLNRLDNLAADRKSKFLLSDRGKKLVNEYVLAYLESTPFGVTITDNAGNAKTIQSAQFINSIKDEVSDKLWAREEAALQRRRASRERSKKKAAQKQQQNNNQNN